MLAFASILEGPSPIQIGSVVNEAYNFIINMIDDITPRVRTAVAFVYYRLSKFVPEIILQSPENLNLFT